MRLNAWDRVALFPGRGGMWTVDTVRGFGIRREVMLSVKEKEDF
jgi:hypothetical protein